MDTDELTARDKIKQRIKNCKERLAQLESALAFLEKHPDAEEVIDVLRVNIGRDL